MSKHTSDEEHQNSFTLIAIAMSYNILSAQGIDKMQWLPKCDSVSYNSLGIQLLLYPILPQVQFNVELITTLIYIQMSPRILILMLYLYILAPKIFGKPGQCLLTSGIPAGEE